MSLAQFQGGDRPFQMMQNSWAKDLNPVLLVPLNSGVSLKSVSLASGDNSVNHLLGRNLQGWFIIRQRASASVYDKQDSNQHPALTLTLNASAAVVVDLFVF